MSDGQWHSDFGQNYEYEACQYCWGAENHAGQDRDEEWTIIDLPTNSNDSSRRENSPYRGLSPFRPIEATRNIPNHWAQPGQISHIDATSFENNQKKAEGTLNLFVRTNSSQQPSNFAEYSSDAAPKLFCSSCQYNPQDPVLTLFSRGDRSPEMSNSCISRAMFSGKREETLEGTCQWLLNCSQFRKWQAQPSGLFWLSGLTGTGKSVLTSYVIYELEASQKPGDIVAFYFADGYYKGTSTVLEILRAILEQMILQDPTEKKHLKLKNQFEQTVDAGTTLSKSSIIYFLSKIRHTLRDQQTLYIVLDGLDELQEKPEERELVLNLIEDASRHDLKHHIKCFLSSNNEFLPPRTWKTLCQVDLDSHPYTRDDMAQYVHGRLENMTIPCGYREPENFPKLVLDSAANSFLLLRLFVEIGHCQQTPPSNTAWNSGVASHQMPPQSLAAMYGYMLGRIQHSNIKAAMSMLRWVANVVRPLDSSELLNALYIQTNIELKEEDISKISAGLLGKIGRQIRFVHISVRDFLQSQLKGRWNDISYEADEMIARECLQLLSPTEVLESLHLIDPKISESTTLVRGHSLLPYARRHWIIHYKRAERRSTFLTGLLHDRIERGLMMSNTAENNLVMFGSQLVEPLGDIKTLLEKTRSMRFRSVNVVNTALRVGCQFNLWKLTKFELEMGADPNALLGAEQRSALHCAAGAGNLDIVRILLQYRANPGVLSGSGNPAVIYAMLNSHFDIVEFLQSHSNTNQQPGRLFPTSITACHATQKLNLITMLTQSCQVCDELQVGYELSAILSHDDDAGLFFPIIVSGESIARSDIYVPLFDVISQPIGSTTVQWYPGPKMFHVLSVASRNGIENVRRLLIAAGNDSATLDTNTSINNLVAKLKLR